jgi:hypothetical protein
MAITFDTASVITSATATTVSRSHTVSAGSDRLLVACLVLNGEDCTGITWNTTQNFVLKRRYTGSDGVLRREIWGLVNPDVGAFNIVASSVGGNTMALAGTSFFGVDQTTPFGTEAVANDQVTFEAVSATVTSVGMCIDCLGLGAAATTIAANGGQTEARNAEPVNLGMGVSIEAASGSVTMGWTWTTGSSNGLIVVPLAEAATLASETGSDSGRVAASDTVQTMTVAVGTIEAG